MRRAALAMALAAALLLSACNALVAQNPGSQMRSVNAQRDGDVARLMLGGYDLVAYFEQGRAVAGAPAFGAEFERVQYRFVSEEHRRRFLADPVKYQPAYHGWDAMRMVFALPERADPNVWRVIDRRLFLFADEASRAAFELDAKTNIAQADRYWKDEVRGQVSSVQWAKRSVDRVSGYKSRDDLAREVAARAKPG